MPVSPVTTAVVPVAGLGTRLLPATKSQPKEMLPVGGKPVVQHVVEELAAAGIERVVFVTGRGKGAIEDHFDRDPMLRAALERRGDDELLRRLAFEDLGVTFAYTRQPEPLGLGDAVLCAAGLGGEAPFAIALGDAILRAPSGQPLVVQRLADALEQHDGACAIAVRDVPRAETGRYGIVATQDTGDVVRVHGLVEKPEPDAAPSTLAVAGRYVMTPAIFGALRATPRAQWRARAHGRDRAARRAGRDGRRGAPRRHRAPRRRNARKLRDRIPRLRADGSRLR